MAFQSAKSVGQQELIRADYERVLNFEEDDYILKKGIDPDIVS